MLMTTSVGEIYLIGAFVFILSNVFSAPFLLGPSLHLWEWVVPMSLSRCYLSLSLSNVCGHSLHFSLNRGSLWDFWLLATVHLGWSFCEASVVSRRQKKCLPLRLTSCGTDLHVMEPCTLLSSWSLDETMQKSLIFLKIPSPSLHHVDHC